MDSCRFGRFEVRPATRELLVDGIATRLGDRAFDLLLALLARRDRLTTSRELLDLIWPGLVVEENNLRQQVAALRRVLGPQAVVNVARRGYRLIVEVPEAEMPVSNEGPVAEAAESVRKAFEMRPVVGVLPFADLSSVTGHGHLADAMAQEIIAGLSRHHWLTVLARNTTFGYRASALDSRAVARELRADYVVSGSLLQAGARLRVSLELVDGESGVALWAGHYECPSLDVLDMLDEITGTILACIEPEIGHAERRRAARRPRTDLRAWDCLHLGLSHLFRFTEADSGEALRLLDASRRMDPEFADAHAWWGYANVLDMVYWSTVPTMRAVDAALAAVRQALELDEHNAVFHALKARVQLARREFDGAIEASRMAIALNPTLALAHCSLADALACQDRQDEAMACFDRALTLSPRDPQRWAFLTYGALALIAAGELRTAAEWALRADAIPNCSYWTQAHWAVALAGQGLLQEAAAMATRIESKRPGFNLRFAEEKLFYLEPRFRGAYLDGLARAGIPTGR